MSLVIKKYPDLSEPIFFYNNKERLRFSPSKWLYVWETLDGLVELSGVSGITKIVDKSAALMPWAVKMAMNRLRALMITRHLGPNEAIELFVNELDAIIAEAKKADKEELETAGGIGHDAHSWIEQLIKAILAEDELRTLEVLAKLPEDERASNCCIGAVEWMVKHNVRWISTERRVFSLEYKFAGTMDGLALIDSCDDPACCGHEFKDRLSIVDWKSSNYLYTTYLMQVAAYEQAYQEETKDQVADRWIIRLGKDDGEFDPWHAEGVETFVEDFEAFKHALNLTLSLKKITERISLKREVRREYKKKIKEALQDEQMKEECKGFKTYKGVRAPKCNGGNPCKACVAKYAEVQSQK